VTEGDLTLTVSDSAASSNPVIEETVSPAIRVDPGAVESGDLVFAGREVTFDSDLDQGETVTLVRDPGDDDQTVSQLQVGEGGLITVDTDGLENDDYAVRDGDTTLVSFEVLVQTLETEFDEDEVENNENETLEVTSNRAESFNVTVEADGASSDDLVDAFRTRGAFVNDDDEV
jgi:hypothetical protein